MSCNAWLVAAPPLSPPHFYNKTNPNNINPTPTTGTPALFSERLGGFGVSEEAGLWRARVLRKGQRDRELVAGQHTFAGLLLSFIVLPTVRPCSFGMGQYVALK